MMTMLGKNGLVTASGDGIGRASALAFASAGARVLVSDIDEAKAAETVALIRENGGTADLLVADASKEDSAIALVEAVVARWGSLDFAHNNAGIGAANAPFTDQEGETWERLLQLNVIGTMYGLKHQLRQMYEQGAGSIVNTASLAGKSGNPGLSAYAATKWAVIGMTKTAAAEAALQGVRVNAICPGGTMTAALQGWKETSPAAFEAVAERIPLGRMALPEEQANAAVWLCSEAASYVTGVALNVDGGDGILGKEQ